MIITKLQVLREATTLDIVHGWGKCPRDGRERPVYVTIGNQRTTVIADGKGHAYKTYTDGLCAYEDKPLPKNLIDPATYEFERGLTGFDF